MRASMLTKIYVMHVINLEGWGGGGGGPGSDPGPGALALALAQPLENIILCKLSGWTPSWTPNVDLPLYCYVSACSAATRLALPHQCN